MAFSLSCRQLHPDPDLGPLKLDLRLTLIFFSVREDVLPNPWIKHGDPTVIWPRDWLPKEEEGLGDNILVLSVECYVHRETDVSVPLERILVRDLVTKTKWKLDRAQRIVLVGHGLGGLVIKSLTIEVDKMSKSDSRYIEKSPEEVKCAAFKQNIRGIVFYSVPHTTSKEEFVNYYKSYATRIVDEVQDLKHFNQYMVLLNVGFEKSIERRIKLFAFVGGQKVMVPQSSTYKLVQNHVCEIENADHFQVCQPLDQQHASYKRLLQFIQEDLELALKPYLLREAKHEVGTSTKTKETEGVPNQQQKLDVMIKTIKDVHVKSPKDLQSLALKEVLGKTSILCAGRKAEKGDSVEFLFMDVGDMAKVVGVGLHWAKVVVTKEFLVKVMQEDEVKWTNLWCSEHFVPRIITILNPKQELMTHPNSTKTNGVELEANLGHVVYVEDEKEENVHACFPLIFELAKHIGLGRENAMKMKEVSGVEPSGSTKGGEVSGVEPSGSTKGGEVSGAKYSGSTEGEVSGAEYSGSTKGGKISTKKSIQSSRQQSSDEENDEEFNARRKGRPNPKDQTSSIDSEEEKKFIVYVYPRPKELSVALKGLKNPPSICPTLKFMFKQNGESRTILSKTSTECNFGSMEIEPIKNDFGFYQDHITICLECKDDDAARVRKRNVKNVQYVKKTMGDTSTTTKNSEFKFGVDIGIGDTIDLNDSHHLTPHGQLKGAYTRSTGANTGHGSSGEVYFSQLDCFFVHQQGKHNELSYYFQYPQAILQQIAHDLSEFKTENTFHPTIKGKWMGLDENERSEYVFHVKRHIFSKANLRGSVKVIKVSPSSPSTEKYYDVNVGFTDTHVPIDEKIPSQTIQHYEVTFWVNHKMENLFRKVTTMSLSEKNLTINGVMGILKCATSNTTT